jgi:PAS domain-containing protein
VNSLRWVLVNAMPLGSPPTGVVTTLADVTQYEKSREHGRTSEANLRKLVDSLPIAILQTDREFTLTYSNHSALSLLNGAAARPKSRLTLADVLHKDDHATVCSLARGSLAGHSGSCECRIQSDSSAETRVRLMIEPRRDRDQIVGTTIAMSEIR